MEQFFEYSTEVDLAIKQKKPVLALESTMITHGLPFPYNLQIANNIEDIAKEHGVTPAIIAIIKGKIKIGLSRQELETIIEDKQILKANRGDIPFILCEGLSAGTTVAATIYCAELAGIKVFSTGGIGGVHRGDDLDVSADLIEIARTPVAIVCSGMKAILDLPKTLEFLETFSIPMIGYRTSTLPAFYSASTRYKLSTRIDDIKSIIRLLNIHWQLGFTSGVLIVNPIPIEDEIPIDDIEPAIVQALRTAQIKNIRGKELTPFLLSEVNIATQGKSLEANLSLIKNNVRLGAILAHSLFKEKLGVSNRETSF